MIDRLASIAQTLKHGSSKHRHWILTVAIGAFFLGMFWAVHSLGLQWSRINYNALVGVFLMLPLSMSLNAYELRLCALATGGDLSFRKALTYSSTATVANILPVPASTVIRGGALLEAGASVAEASKMILAAGLIWLSMASALTVFALFTGWVGWAACALAVLVTAIISHWITTKSTLQIALQFIGVRIAMIILLTTRLWLCFIAIGEMLLWLDTAIYSVVGIIGNAAAIVPAGIGVTEGLGALLAPASGSLAPAAFLALAINRLTGLFGSGFAALLLASRYGKAPAPKGAL